MAPRAVAAAVVVVVVVEAAVAVAVRRPPHHLHLVRLPLIDVSAQPISFPSTPAVLALLTPLRARAALSRRRLRTQRRLCT